MLLLIKSKEMERFKKIIEIITDMNIKQLSLDEILSKTQEEGIAFAIDESLTSLKRYKFLLNADVVGHIIEEIKTELLKSRNYTVRKEITRSGDIEKGLEFDYSRLPEKEDKEFWRYFTSPILEVIGASDNYYFGGVHILDPSSSRSQKVKGSTKSGTNIFHGQKIGPSEDERVLMIEGIYAGGRKDPFLNLMRVFYSAYQNLKTPSKT